ncbi:hypothetical protein BOTBODRAFT_627710 [Botryobasidium botryosum FD-172 SS1]|uniref:Uncharacterized protein n=1 Tax=Botryobasidium botryosum (strain FD-172 SS1) TaxID=930990 RepID=A0A067N228_BOTB1|nr:hypothetical protein BOTBODRAFT_627710 [Botryobasidium botryosum FD-172 SS1]
MALVCVLVLFDVPAPRYYSKFDVPVDAASALPDDREPYIREWKHDARSRNTCYRARFTSGQAASGFEILKAFLTGERGSGIFSILKRLIIFSFLKWPFCDFLCDSSDSECPSISEPPWYYAITSTTPVVIAMSPIPPLYRDRDTTSGLTVTRLMLNFWPYQRRQPLSRPPIITGSAIPFIRITAPSTRGWKPQTEKNPRQIKAPVIYAMVVGVVVATGRSRRIECGYGEHDALASENLNPDRSLPLFVRADRGEDKVPVAKIGHRLSESHIPYTSFAWGLWSVSINACLVMSDDNGEEKGEWMLSLESRKGAKEWTVTLNSSEFWMKKERGKEKVTETKMKKDVGTAHRVRTMRS